MSRYLLLGNEISLFFVLIVDTSHAPYMFLMLNFSRNMLNSLLNSPGDKVI